MLTLDRIKRLKALPSLMRMEENTHNRKRTNEIK
jgi:hypothetical protein